MCLTPHHVVLGSFALPGSRRLSIKVMKNNRAIEIGLWGCLKCHFNVFGNGEKKLAESTPVFNSFI